jgi:hypothetical protein
MLLKHGHIRVQKVLNMGDTCPHMNLYHMAQAMSSIKFGTPELQASKVS